MRNKLAALVMLVLMVLSVLLVWSPPAQGQSVTPDFSMTMERGEIKLDVRPGQTGSDTNVINIDNPSTYTLAIEITSSCGKGVTVTPSIATVSVGPQSSTTQPLSVSALPKAPLNQIDCPVRGRVTQVDGVSYPGDVTRNTAFKTLILQFALVAVESNTPFLRIGPGKQTILTFNIRNSGNYIDDYQITIPDAKKLEDAGFSIALATPVLQNVPPQDYVVLKISIQTPRGTIVGWSDDYFSIEVNAASIIEGDRGDAKSATTTFWIRGVFLPGFDPLFTITALGLVAVVFAQRRNKPT